MVKSLLQQPAEELNLEVIHVVILLPAGFLLTSVTGLNPVCFFSPNSVKAYGKQFMNQTRQKRSAVIVLNVTFFVISVN